ncbi:twin-arginine translocase subunit TatC [Ohtaekwangia koreensis]|uniref:Sec-independent protein translocase protein TatC n=1 Tax=Ohtaekwangia koreensis TaxID=688867 RepID=A0A1T5LFM3_9BACT|nr:twin-arginine translocase subunit TatC [Ohtaekwangia koreensis]SKC74783.1 sec-independent protein translocase protein TatC [Ohtaekwangia koreensis]
MPLDQDPIEEESGEKEMSFLDHLEELRWHVIRSLAAIVIFTIFAFVQVKWIFTNVILAPAKSNFWTWRMFCKLGQAFSSQDLCIEDIQLELQSRFMTGQFTITIVAAFIIGLVFAFPYVVWELWRFIKPGLKVNERKNSTGVVASVSLLFLSGILFGYYVIAPLMVYVMVNYQISDMIRNEFDITSYVSTVVTLVFGSGLLFQLPVVIYFLSKIGLVTPAFLRKYRKHSVVIILVIAAIITPPDPLSQTLISIPLYLLFEISIIISARVEKQKLKEEAEERLREQQSTPSPS